MIFLKLIYPQKWKLFCYTTASFCKVIIDTHRAIWFELSAFTWTPIESCPSTLTKFNRHNNCTAPIIYVSCGILRVRPAQFKQFRARQLALSLNFCRVLVHICTAIYAGNRPRSERSVLDIPLLLWHLSTRAIGCGAWGEHKLTSNEH